MFFCFIRHAGSFWVIAFSFVSLRFFFLALLAVVVARFWCLRLSACARVCAYAMACEVHYLINVAFAFYGEQDGFSN